MTPIIETRKLAKTYGRGEGQVHALRGVDLVIEPGEYVSIMGPSGCGKSTLLHCLGLLAEPTAGEVRIDGAGAGRAAESERTRLRRQYLGFVFQRFNLLPTLSAEDNIALPLRLRHHPVGDRPEELLEAVGLEGKRRRKPSQLSVGEQQRVAIARALATEPKVLLADEPTGNLDTAASERVLDLIERLAGERQQTIVLITHNEAVAERARRTVRMQDGRLLD